MEASIPLKDSRHSDAKVITRNSIERFWNEGIVKSVTALGIDD